MPVWKPSVEKALNQVPEPSFSALARANMHLGAALLLHQPFIEIMFYILIL